MKTRKILAIVLAAVMCAVLFASCGTEKDNRPVVTIGYTIYDPMNYFDDNGELVGFDTDLAKAVFEKLGYKVLFTEIKWENKYTDLSSGNIDVIWNGFTANSADDDGIQRSEKVDFSYYYMGNTQVLIAKKDSGITGDTATLNGKIGKAEAGSAGYTYLKTFEEYGIVAGEVTAQVDALLEIVSGACDFAILDESLAKSYAGKGDYADIAIVEEYKSEGEYYGIGFKKGSDLTAKVNGALEELAADGTMMGIAKKYGVEKEVIVDFADQKK